jgi:hypothetical protein
VIYAVVPLVVTLIVLWLGRRLAAALVILAYLSIEGFLKLLSNYNRIVHVGVDIIVLSLAAYLVLQAVVEHRAHLDELPYTKLILVYALWMVLQVLNPNAGSLVQSIAAFKVHLTMVPLYFIAATLFREPRDLIKFIFGLTVIVLVPFSMSLIQYALGPSSVLDLSPRFWANISYYHDWRPFGTSAVPGGSSVMAYLAVPLTSLLLVAPEVRKTIKPIALICLLLAAGTFVVSGIRQVFLGCVLSLAVMSLLMMMRRSGRIAIVAGIVAAIGFAGYVGVITYLRPMAQEAVLRDPRAPEIWRERDVTQRLSTLASGSTYRQARDNPLAIIIHRATRFPFGAGMGRTGSASGAFKEQVAQDAASSRVQADVGWSDDFFADIIAEGGIPALVMLVWLLLGMTWRAYHLARSADNAVIIGTSAALTGFFFSILIMSYGSSPLLGNPITAFFWFFAGMCAAMERMDVNERRQAEQVEVLEEALDGGMSSAHS